MLNRCSQINKENQLRNYSDPEYVMQKAKMMGLNPVHESSRKEKKYLVFSPFENKMIHFGQNLYEDYTKHHDENRLIKLKKYVFGKC